MKCIIIDSGYEGRPIIHVETKFLWMKTVTKYQVDRQLVANAGYHSWVELPNNIMVPETLGLQLDTWLRTFHSNKG